MRVAIPNGSGSPPFTTSPLLTIEQNKGQLGHCVALDLIEEFGPMDNVSLFPYGMEPGPQTQSLS